MHGRWWSTESYGIISNLSQGIESLGTRESIESLGASRAIVGTEVISR